MLQVIQNLSHYCNGLLPCCATRFWFVSCCAWFVYLKLYILDDIALPTDPSSSLGVGMKQFKLYRWLPKLVSCAFLLVMLALGLSAGAQSANLLTNPGFEQPFATVDGVPARIVAQGWTPWHIGGGQSASENVQPEYYPASDATNGLGIPRVRNGSDAQQYLAFFATLDGGVYQRVTGVASGRPGALEIILMTSMRKPSMPLSSHQRIMSKTSARTLGFSQLRSGCFLEKRCR